MPTSTRAVGLLELESGFTGTEAEFFQQSNDLDPDGQGVSFETNVRCVRFELDVCSALLGRLLTVAMPLLIRVVLQCYRCGASVDVA
jgi:hypothetical protein